MKARYKLLIITILAITVMMLSAAIGSVFVPPLEICKILLNKLLGLTLSNPPSEQAIAIFWSKRLPRALLAFVAGAGLSVSGVIMQSVLRNPLASSYTLGVSSGAAVGAGIATLMGITFFGMFTIPFFGLVAGLGTVFLSVALASKLDRHLENHAIILMGMALSLFMNAMLSFILAWAREYAQRLIYWQLGSFAMKRWEHPAILYPIVIAGLVTTMVGSREMDILTLGDEQSLASGVSVRRIKWRLLIIGAALTGCITAIAGVIGFLDLFTPHAARKLFGSRHVLVLPASAIMGGAFMSVCDLVARTAASPLELPVGAVTAAVGAPFFVYLYFSGQKMKKKVSDA